jgi:hypothetical protein
MQKEISWDSTSIWAKEQYAIAVKTFKISYFLAGYWEHWSEVNLYYCAGTICLAIAWKTVFIKYQYLKDKRYNERKQNFSYAGTVSLSKL